MKRPPIGSVETAIAWLEVYDEGSAGAAECAAVAAWLRDQVQVALHAQVETAAIARLAAERGTSPAALRRELAAARRRKRGRP